MHNHTHPAEKNKKVMSVNVIWECNKMPLIVHAYMRFEISISAPCHVITFLIHLFFRCMKEEAQHAKIAHHRILNQSSKNIQSLEFPHKLKIDSKLSLQHTFGWNEYWHEIKCLPDDTHIHCESREK